MSGTQSLDFLLDTELDFVPPAYTDRCNQNFVGGIAQDIVLCVTLYPLGRPRQLFHLELCCPHVKYGSCNSENKFYLIFN